MKIPIILFYSIFFCFIFGVGSSSPVCAQFNTVMNDNIQLKHGYSVHVHGSETDCIDCGKKDVNTITIVKNGTIIFQDSTDWHSGRARRMPYPILLHFDSTHDELLTSTREDGIIRLIIKNGEVVKIDSLPRFDGAFFDKSSGGPLIFSSGFKDINYWWNDDTMNTYIPQFFTLTTKSLLFDTSLTRSVQRDLLGKYCGFHVSSLYSFQSPESQIAKFKRAYNRNRKSLHYLTSKELQSFLENEF